MTAEKVNIVERPVEPSVLEAALAHGYTPLQASIIARRLPAEFAPDLQRYVRPEMRDLDPPDLLPDIGPAVARIATAVVTGEPLILCVDHDADGVDSLAVVYGALVDAIGVPPEQVHVYTSHRLREGYGVSDALVDRILASGLTRGLLITADQGSSDEPRIARLRAAGIETVVTDHHGVEGAGPPSAVACVNPCREDSAFPDRYIAGCHVAWLVMAALRRELIAWGHLPEDAPKLGFLLPYVALGTAADCVSFAKSRNNRLIVQAGLHMMNTRRGPCWEALAQVKGVSGPITAETLGFYFAPMINAGGRLDDAMPGFHLMRSRTLDEALIYADQLNRANEERKGIERGMRDAAMQDAARQVEDGARAICVWMPEGHSGVHGVVASRLTEAFGRPTLCLSPKQGEPGVVTGSARSVPGFNVREAFLAIDAQAPGMLLKFGGHAGAGGLTLREADIDQLRLLWNVVALTTEGARIGPTKVTDGPLPCPPSLELLSELAALEPYGREFDAPVFSQELYVVGAKRVGEGGKHMKLEFAWDNAPVVPAIWFNVPAMDWEPGVGDRVEVVFSLSSNTFRGNTSVQLQVHHLDHWRGYVDKPQPRANQGRLQARRG